MEVKVKFVGQEVSQSLKDYLEKAVSVAYYELRKVKANKLTLQMLKIKHPKLDVSESGEVSIAIDAANFSVRDIMHLAGANYYARTQESLEKAFQDTQKMLKHK